MTSRKFRRDLVVAERGANSLEFVRRNAHSDSRPADEDAAIRAPFRHRFRDRRGNVGLVDSLSLCDALARPLVEAVAYFHNTRTSRRGFDSYAGVLDKRRARLERFDWIETAVVIREKKISR